MISKGEKASEIIRKGSAAVLLYPWAHPSGRPYWRWMWHDPDTGKRKYGTRSSYKEAKGLASDRARELSGGFLDLNALPDAVKRNITRLLKADPGLTLVDEYLSWRQKSYPVKDLKEAADELIALTDANKGDSIQNLKTLRKNLTPFAAAFPARHIGSITVPEVSGYLLANKKWKNRTRRNARASIVTLFRWAQASGYLPDGKTAPERTAVPKVTRKAPVTWKPKEMALLLHSAKPEYVSWLACTALGGFRADEIYPLTGGTKSPLDWSDFKWDREIVIVRDETSKTNRRIVPILPALRSWLWPIKKDSGPVGSAIHPPTKRGRGKGAEAETKRLGALVGGWRTNASRHTWITCRSAKVGIAQAAMEAGNSESESKASYIDAVGPDEADEWFALTREKVAEALRNITA